MAYISYEGPLPMVEVAEQPPNETPDDRVRLRGVHYITAGAVYGGTTARPRAQVITAPN